MMRTAIVVILGLLLIIDIVLIPIWYEAFLYALEKPEMKNLPVNEYKLIGYVLVGFLVIDIAILAWLLKR